MGVRVPGKILIVEDHSDSANMLAVMLSMKGYETCYAENGEDGFHLALTEKPDLVLTDLEMPTANGVDLIRMLRATKETAHLPVIAMTAYRTIRVEAARRAGANGVHYKPIKFDQLHALIEQFLPVQ